MKRTLSLLGVLLLAASGCSDQPLAPETQLTPDAPLSAVATAEAITITSIDGPTDPVAINTPVKIGALFAGAHGDTHTGVIWWGDGASTVATITEADGAGSAIATRSYVLPGVYTVQVEIRNQSGASVLATHEYITVYDPDGGYVSGNGSILSPPNACSWSGCVAGEGVARFGFSSRYQRGATVPSGNTRFTFRDGNFTFTSTAYEWLVVAGARAQYKGVGTVNREGNYGFMLTAIDSDRPGGGEEDRFRIKIWDRDNEDAVVYDNQAGEGDDASLTADGTRLTRGSITVRSTTRNEAPVVIITSPSDGAPVLETTGLLLSANAGDAEDGDLSASVAWSSDVAGELGVGAELSGIRLAPGAHTITARVTDSGGLEASASVAVKIAEVTISVSPAAATISEGETQQFIATVYADGVEMLSGAPTVAWSSSDVGVATVDSDGLATGASTGQATITAAIGGVTDEALLTVEDGFEILSHTLTAGDHHSCGLTISGDAYCWGQNTEGRLGNGSNTNSNTPVLVRAPAGVTFASISAGWGNTVALSTEGVAYAWGGNAWGQLGDGSNTSRSEPVAVQTGMRFVSISAGRDHTLALSTTGVVYTWGRNHFGQLGNSTTTDSYAPVAVHLPAEVEVASIAAGEIHNVILTATGVAYAWGYNRWGAVGDASNVDRYAPVPVSMPGGVSFVSISVGSSHNMALTATGAAYGWGWNYWSQLGDGSFQNRNRPVAVSMPSGVSFASISPGFDHTLALTSTGEAYAWGLAALGRLGVGYLPAERSYVPIPVMMPVGVEFSSIYAGRWHSVALATTGIAYSWGDNRFGQLGDGTTVGIDEPTLVSGGIVFKQ